MHITSVMNYTVRQFINNFLQEYGFFNYMNICSYCNCYGVEEEDGGFYIDDYSLPFWLYYGLSKICLSFNDKKIVVKIPMINDCSYNKDKVNFFKTKVRNGQYSNFNNNENLCEVEANIYELAKEKGLSDLFAAEEKLMIYHGIPVYLQEKVQIYCDTPDCADDYDLNLNEEINDLLIENYSCLDEDQDKVIEQFTQNIAFVERLYKEIGKERFIQLLNFLINNYINDLHSGNIGYGEKGELKLMDYSGYDN